jgi:hypothetical protein
MQWRVHYERLEDDGLVDKNEPVDAWVALDKERQWVKVALLGFKLQG